MSREDATLCRDNNISGGPNNSNVPSQNIALHLYLLEEHSDSKSLLLRQLTYYLKKKIMLRQRCEADVAHVTTRNAKTLVCCDDWDASLTLILPTLHILLLWLLCWSIECVALQSYKMELERLLGGMPSLHTLMYLEERGGSDRSLIPISIR